LFGEPFERAEVVVRRARPAVEREQRCRRRVEVSHEPVPRPVPAEVDVSLARPHRGYHPRTNALLAQLVEHLHGKEGVSGSSPEEGFALPPAHLSFPFSGPTPAGVFGILAASTSVHGLL